MNRLRKNLAAALLVAPLTLTAACSGGDVDAEAPTLDVEGDPGDVDVDAPEVDAPDVDAPDVDVDADVDSTEDGDSEAGSGG